jgi:hypothetical protein
MLNAEAFELVEQRKEEGVTAEYLAKRLGITPRSAASWLSKWARRGFLKYVPYNGGGIGRLEELEAQERSGTLSASGVERLKSLREFKSMQRHGPRGIGKPKGAQGHYVLGDAEWGSYRHGKLEERMAIRERIKKW